ncbi:hypothetical protein AB1Y20_002086 [Prymnesium parvum]|uniref:FHA domain-containing protein n=1 Tax=Prymnesium parvum TaxID=97485 RepID=A0AB34JAP3_PRYPA
MAAVLQAWKEGSLLEQIDVSTPRTYSIGRSEAADIVVEHPSCSRKHAELVVSPCGSVRIVDLSSAQGTWVDNRRLLAGEPASLRDLSRITFAASSRVYLLKLAAQAEVATTGLSAQEKRKLLWGNKRDAAGVSGAPRRTAAANASGWSAQAAALGDSERQEKFLSLMGAKRHKADLSPQDAAAPEAAAAQRRQEAMFAQLEAQFHQASSSGKRSL